MLNKSSIEIFKIIEQNYCNTKIDVLSYECSNELIRKRGGEVKYNFCKLKGKITEVFGNQYSFAKKMHWSEHTCSFKLSGKIYWKQDEITKACKLLDISDSELQSYFFTLNVQ